MDGALNYKGRFLADFSGAPTLAASDGALLGMLDSVGFAPLREETGAGFHVGLVVPTDLLSGPP